VLPPPFLTLFTNDTHVAQADNTPDKGGGGCGFRPHELLEAALASCMNMTLRMAAKECGIPLSGVVVTVSLNRSQPASPTFECRIQFPDDLSAPHRERLLASLAHCHVRNTLSKSPQFKVMESPGIRS
jgi:putative redox protein